MLCKVHRTRNVAILSSLELFKREEHKKHVRIALGASEPLFFDNFRVVRPSVLVRSSSSVLRPASMYVKNPPRSLRIVAFDSFFHSFFCPFVLVRSILLSYLFIVFKDSTFPCTNQRDRRKTIGQSEERKVIPI